MKSTPVTPAFVRSSLLSSPKRLATLSEAEVASLAPGTRGCLPANVVKAFNKGRPSHRQYVAGQGKAVAAQAKADAQATRDALRAQGVTVGARGPLPGSKPKSAATKG